MGHKPGRQFVAGTQHSERIHAAALHDVEIEAGRENGLTAGDDDGGAVRLSLIERPVYLIEYLRRQALRLPSSIRIVATLPCSRY